MLFYFSGTGNSQWVATQLAKHFSDNLIAIGKYEHKEAPITPKFEVQPNEKIGFVFPVHSWGMPPIVARFIDHLQLRSYNNQLIYCIMTCGDECSYTDRQFLKIIQNKGLSCHHVYSIQMPNSYICMKGFDVDRKDIEEQKKKQAKMDLPLIIKAIEQDRPIDFYIKGKHFSFIKSKAIYPMFAKHALTDKPFTVSDQCTSCGTCVKVCPVDNIKLIDGKPVWLGDCTQCLACIHHCPTKAIEYGKATQNKGRYFFR